MNFLPQDYQAPSSAEGSYMRFQQGANKFRVLSPAVTGWEYWTIDEKPVRSREAFTTTPANARLEKGQKGEDKFVQKHFWAFVVYNYQTKAIEILQVTQRSIQKAISGYAQSEDWGDPSQYDITVNRKGEGLTTEYTVQPSPHKPLDPEVKKEYQSMTINLDALFDGGNPFQASAGSDDDIEELDF